MRRTPVIHFWTSPSPSSSFSNPLELKRLTSKTEEEQQQEETFHFVEFWANETGDDITRKTPIFYTNEKDIVWFLSWDGKMWRRHRFIDKMPLTEKYGKRFRSERIWKVKKKREMLFVCNISVCKHLLFFFLLLSPPFFLKLCKYVSTISLEY